MLVYVKVKATMTVYGTYTHFMKNKQILQWCKKQVCAFKIIIWVNQMHQVKGAAYSLGRIENGKRNVCLISRKKPNYLCVCVMCCKSVEEKV